MKKLFLVPILVLFLTCDDTSTNDLSEGNFLPEDTTHPELTEIDATYYAGDQIIIRFSKKMDPGTAEKASNYIRKASKIQFT